MAGNLPLVGFHDLLCVFITGHRAQVKLSEKDPYLLPHLLNLLGAIDAEAAQSIQLVDKLRGFDAVIATGSDNSARYFEAYFGKYPHIIRRNRNGLAALHGDELEEDLHLLGKDIFTYFGLGCRNVSKIYVPRDYPFEPLLKALHEYRDIILNHKYKHNFDYQYALLVLNKEPFRNTGSLILREDASTASPVATLHYSYYADVQDLEQDLDARQEGIQCLVAPQGWLSRPVLPFGQTQHPELWDYADGVDTMSFLLSLPGKQKSSRSKSPGAFLLCADPRPPNYRNRIFCATIPSSKRICAI